MESSQPYLSYLNIKLHVAQWIEREYLENIQKVQ